MTNSLDGAEERGGIFMIMMMWWLSLTIFGGLFWSTLPFLSEHTTGPSYSQKCCTVSNSKHFVVCIRGM